MASKQNKQLDLALHRALFEQVVPNCTVGMVLAVSILIYLYDYVPTTPLLTWFSLIIVLSLVRIALSVRVRAAPQQGYPVGLYNVLVGGTALVWGSVFFLWHAQLPINIQLVFVLLSWGLTIGVVLSFGAWYRTYCIFVGGLQLPLLLKLLWQYNEDTSRVLFAVFMFCCICLVLAFFYNRQLRETQILRVKNQTLVNDLSAQNASLKQSRDDLEHACSSKDEFLARMSHELRTPMNGVLGMSALLSKTLLDAEQKNLVSTLHQSGEKMLNLVSDLLDASSLSNGRLTLENGIFDIRDCVTQLVVTYRKTANDASVMLSLSVEDNVMQAADGDVSRISQLLSKVLDNAIKFSRGAEVTVHVSSPPLKDDESTQTGIFFCIQDTGIGIDASELPFVCDMFKQGEESSTRRYGGSGLGLSLAKHLTTLMGGRLTVESTLGEGTRVSIYLPLQEAAAPLRAPVLNPVTYDSTASVHSIVAVSPPIDGSSADSDGTASPILRTLVAEDNLVNQLVIDAVLSDLGCHVTLVENGQEALDVLDQQTFDIVFMDCQMPELDGYEATRQARKKGLILPIVAVTANMLAGDRKKCLDSGMDDYVSKPFTEVTLESMLEKWVEDYRSRAAFQHSA